MSARRPPRAVIAAGGTGGHMFPAQALAEILLERGWEVELSTDVRGARYAGGFPDAVAVRQVSAGSFAQGGAVGRLLTPLRILLGIGAAKWRMLARRPSVVVGFGGYPSVPALTAAWALRVPRMIHEQNGVLGRVNNLAARRVNLVACGIWPTDLPRGTRAVHTGNPVRAGIRDVAGAPFPATDGADRRLLVIGGSQGARILSDVVPTALAALPDALRAGLSVAHQARPEDIDRVTAAYAAAGIAAEVKPFFDDIPKRLSATHLVIARSGASTVADLGAVGRPSILVPFAAALRDHQTANARGLSTAGAAEVLTEAEFTPDTLTPRLAALLEDPARLTQMAAAARDTGQPQAALALADLVENLADGQRDLGEVVK